MIPTAIYRYARQLFFGIIISLFIFCSKKDFLDTKPNQALIVPSSISDFQALLDNDISMNGAGNVGICPMFSEITNDDIYVPDQYYTRLDQASQKEYVWDGNPYPTLDLPDWDYPYQAVWYANTALDGLAKVTATPSQMASYNNVKGDAFFFRSFYFYALAQVFAPPYDSTTASTDLGLPLRLSSDINEKISRASIKQTYDQIINDAKQAIGLLPNIAPYITRPGKASAYGLLARVYLALKDYRNANLYADSSLNIYNTIIDYNTLNASATFPIARNNAENLFTTVIVGNAIWSYHFIDTTFYQSYSPNDLRLSIFFYASGTGHRIKCTYDGSRNFYQGIAVDELLLIRAETAARLGNLGVATSDINKLCTNRYKAGTFNAYNFATSSDALQVILLERRKELIARGLRSTDLRRFNKNPQTAITLKRVVNRSPYTLPPNDPKWTWLIPDKVLSFNPGMQQNVR